MRLSRLVAVVVFAVVSISATTQANALPILTFGFDCITNNNATSAAIGEAQFFLDVVSIDTTHVGFVLRNTGPQAGTIANVYFDSEPLKAITSIVDPCGVHFDIGGSPSHLPGGNTLADPFVTTSGLLARAKNPAPKWGVNGNEQVELICSLKAGESWTSVIDDMESGDLRVGIHAISISTGRCGSTSESFVNANTPNPPSVPEPATLALVAGGILGARRIHRKK